MRIFYLLCVSNWRSLNATQFGTVGHDYQDCVVPFFGTFLCITCNEIHGQQTIYRLSMLLLRPYKFMTRNRIGSYACSIHSFNPLSPIEFLRLVIVLHATRCWSKAVLVYKFYKKHAILTLLYVLISNFLSYCIEAEIVQHCMRICSNFMFVGQVFMRRVWSRHCCFTSYDNNYLTVYCSTVLSVSICHYCNTQRIGG